jgi:hypothetical protein
LQVKLRRHKSSDHQDHLLSVDCIIYIQLDH